MRHTNTILGIGIALVLIPLLGFPPAWNKFFIIVLGLWLCGLVISMRYIGKFSGKEAESAKRPQVSVPPFVDNKTARGLSERGISPNTHEQTPTG